MNNNNIDLKPHSTTIALNRIRQLCKQYEKHINPPNKKVDDFSYLELLKYSITRDLLHNVEHPKKILELLQKKCTDQHFSSMSNADVLRMNRSSPVSFFLKGLLVLLTFPVFLPLLMFLSFYKRGTLNFLKADGAIFLESLIPLCTNWVEPPPSSASGNTSTSLTNSTLRGTDLMLRRTNISQTAIVPLKPKASEPDDPMELQRVKNSDFKNMSRLASRMAGIFPSGPQYGDAPRQTVDQMLSHFKGQAMIIGSDPIRAVGVEDPNALRLKFTCQLMYTDAPLVECEITLFKTFLPMVRIAPTYAMSIATGANAEQQSTQLTLIERSQRYCLSFFEDNFNSAMRKGHANVGKVDASDLFKTVKCYEWALTLATTDEERLMAIEAILNSIDASRSFFKYKGGFLYEKIEVIRQKKTTAALGQLPPGYRLLSADIQHITALYQSIWACLEANQLENAVTLFDGITLSHFIKQSCPELDAMYFQFLAVFEINGEHSHSEENAFEAGRYLQAAFRRLTQQNYSLCLMTEYSPLRGAELGKIYLTATADAPLNYVVRNDDDTADWVGTITQEEIIENGIRMSWYCPSCPEDFIANLDVQLPRIIATLVEKGHARQPCTPEAALIRQQSIKPLGKIQLLAAKAWENTPFEDARARAYAFDDRANEILWTGCHPSIRQDRAPTCLPKEAFLFGQAAGWIDPSIHYPDDDTAMDDANMHTSIRPTGR